MRNAWEFFTIAFILFVAFSSLPIQMILAYNPAVASQYVAGYSIQLNVTQTTVYWGNPIVVEGTVNASYPLPIRVAFYEYYKDILEYENVTAMNGVFQVKHYPSNVGYWRITAVVDKPDVSSESNSVEVVVKYNVPPPPSPKKVTSSISQVGVPISLFTETTNYIRINFTSFIIDFYKSGYEVIYAKNGTTLVYYHNLVLEYYNDKVKDWRQCGSFTGLSWIKISDYEYQIIKKYSDASTTPITNYTITYSVRGGSPIKITIRIESGASRQYRLHWSFDGIVYSDWMEKKNDANVKNRLVFGDESKAYNFIAFDWQDIYQQFKSDISSYSVDTSAKGKKLDVYFNIGSVDANNVLTVDPSIIGTVSMCSAIYDKHQRKTFYANGRFWVFYTDGTNMMYSSSVDGETWTTPAVAAPNVDSSTFTVWFDGTYLHYEWYNPYNIFYRRGYPNSDGTITWSAPEQAISTVPGGSPGYAVLAVDSNGYPWIIYRGGAYLNVYVIKSRYNNGTWVTEFTYNTTISSTALNIVPLSNGKMFITWQSGGVVYGKAWNGTGWLNTVSTSFTVSYVVSMASLGDVVHLASIDSSYNVVYFKYDYASNSFSSPTIWNVGIASSACDVSISVDPVDGSIYIFGYATWVYQNSIWKSNYIHYIKYSSGSWGNWIAWIAETFTSSTNLLTSFHQSGNGKIGVLYVSGASSPYNLKFAYLSTSLLSISGFQAPNIVYARMPFTLNATIVDGYGVKYFVNATIQLSNGVILKWDNATNTFTVISDPNSYCILDSAGSFKTQLNSTAYKLTFKLQFKWTAPEGYISIQSANTKVYDNTGASATGSINNLFYFEDDVIIQNPAVDDTDGRVNPNQPLKFTAKIYYEGTSTPPTVWGLSFDGVNDYVDCGNPPSLRGLTELTVAVWIKRYSYVRHAAVVGEDYVAEFSKRGFKLFTDYPNIGLWICDGSATDQTTEFPITNNVWTHLVGVFKGGSFLKNFKDGVEIYSKSTTIQRINPNIQLNKWIGRYAYYYFNGLIGEVRIYSRALTSDEINRIYNTGEVITDGLVLWLTPSSIIESTWYDLSGNNNHGTIYGATLEVAPRIELNGQLIQTAYGTIKSDGTITIQNIFAPSTVGIYTYKIYAVTTDQPSVINQTVSVIVDKPIVKAVDFDANGNAVFNLASAYDNSQLSHSKMKLNENTTKLYAIQYGLNNQTWNLYERNYGAKTIKLTTLENKTLTFNLISDVEGKIDFNVTGPATVKIWLGDLGQPYQVLKDGAVWTNWTYNANNRVLTVNVPGSRITLIYQTTVSGGGGGGGIIPTPTPSPTIQPTPITAPQLPISLVNAGILLIALVVIGAFLYSEYESRQNVAKKWRKKRSQTKSSVTWKKRRRFE